MQKSHYGFVLKVVPQNLHTIGQIFSSMQYEADVQVKL